jgi:hypothetical protein
LPFTASLGVRAVELGRIDRLPTCVSIPHVGTVVEPMVTVIETITLTAPADVLVLLEPSCRPRVTPTAMPTRLGSSAWRRAPTE